MATKVATVIANETGQGLTVKVGSRNCFAKLANVEDGGAYIMRLCVDWTYQEFLLEGTSNAGKKLFLSSDDCCDYKRITIKESEGVFVVETVPRNQPASEITQESESTNVQKKLEKSRWRFCM